MCFSFSGYGTALSFKDIDETDIQAIENYIRTILPSILDSALAEQKLEYTLNEKLWFYGPFASAPQHFSFPPGELKTLFALVRYVKQKVDEPNECEGLDFFANDAVIAKKELAYENNTVESVFGLIFGCLREKKQAQLIADLKAKRKDLFNKSSAIFQQIELEEEATPVQPFTLELVNVKYSEQKWKGKVRCVFCNENDISGDVSVFFSLPNRWVLANLTRHISNYHTNTINKENVPKSGNVQTIKLKVEPVKEAKIDDKADEIMLPPEMNANLTDPLSIEDDIYGQLTTQCIKMANCTSNNKDKVQSKCAGKGSNSTRQVRSVKYCKMSSNGDCFFLSVAHQLFNLKAGSKEHEDKALELRKSVVTYIKRDENFPNFLHDLKSRIEYDNQTADDELKTICSEFLDDDLSKPGTWAGMESLKAICEMENINLVVVNEDGKSYLPNHFNPQAKKSLLLLFGSTNGKQCAKNVDRSHYDSIVSIHTNKISEIAHEINEKEGHHNKFVEEAADRSAIAID